MRYLFLFDLDNTLFNSASYRKKLFSLIENVCLVDGIVISSDYLQDVYNKQIKNVGVFDPDVFLLWAFKEKKSKELLQKIRELIFDQSLLREHFHGDVISTFKELSRFGEIGIFSQGEENIQRAKLSRVSQWISEKKIHVTPNKRQQLKKVFGQYKEYKVFFIDDILPILQEAKQISPSLTTIWIKRGRYAEVQEDIPGFKADASVLTLHEAADYIKTSIKNHK